jgi:hypothetical protein
VLTFAVENHPHSPFAHFRGKLVRGLAHDAPSYSGVGASGKPGAVQPVPIDHRDDKGLARFLEKHIDYARWEARRYAKLKENPDAWGHFTGRQRFKYRHLAKWWYPGFYFLFTYIAKRGFLDGGAGLHYAAYKAWYFRTIRLLIHEQAVNGT